MNYLLVNHVPLAYGRTRATYRVGDMWLEDLRAQARAVADAGGRLIVATPCVSAEQLAGGGATSGSFNTVEITPDDHGFEYVPLPHYVSMRGFLKVRAALKKKLAGAIATADVVQMGYGGHPVPLGKVAWPIAGRLGKRRIWVFDGADPFPRLRLEAQGAKNPLKRLAKTVYMNRFERFCRKAVAGADLVFAHNAAVVKRFEGAWGEHCHQFDRSFVTDETLLTDREWAERKARMLDKSRPLRLAVAGRQIVIKATDHVIRAVAKLRRLSVPVELDVLGDGADLDVFKQAAAEANVAEHVRFRGTVPYGKPLFDVWADADAIVITNLTAEISRNVLLGAARGLAIVTYRNPGTDAMLADADAALLVPRGEVDALAEAILTLHRDRGRMVELAANGLRLAESKTLDATHRKRAELAASLVKSEVGSRKSEKTPDVTPRPAAA